MQPSITNRELVNLGGPNSSSFKKNEMKSQSDSIAWNKYFSYVCRLGLTIYNVFTLCDFNFLSSYDLYDFLLYKQRIFTSLASLHTVFSPRVPSFCCILKDKSQGSEDLRPIFHFQFPRQLGFPKLIYQRLLSYWLMCITFAYLYEIW